MQVIKNVAGKAKDTVTNAADKTVGVFKKDNHEDEHEDGDKPQAPAPAGGDSGKAKDNNEGATEDADASGSSKEPAEKGSVCQFKRGDYMIHVLIS